VAEVDVEARVGIVRTAFDFVNRGDVDAALAYCTEDIEFLPLSAAEVEGRHYIGHDGVREWQREREETWDLLEFSPDDFELVGSRALIFGRSRARGKASGVEFEIPIAWVFDFRDDKISRVEAFAEGEDARAAFGRSPA
jgi:ketosteroid isomerase-like protein